MFKNFKFSFDHEGAFENVSEKVKKQFNKIVDKIDKDESWLGAQIRRAENKKIRSYKTKNDKGYSINIELPGYIKSNINIELNEAESVLIVSGNKEVATIKEKFSEEFIILEKDFTIGSTSLTEGILSINIIDNTIESKVKEPVIPNKKINIG